MPIEFRCTKCGKLLRVPDETAGKQARCPECGTILGIPAGNQSAPPQSAAPLQSSAGFASPPDSGNPYQSPAPTANTERPAITPQRLTFEAAYVHTWRIFIRKCPVLYAAIVVLTLLGLGQIFAKHALAELGTPMLAALAIVWTLFHWWLLVGVTHLFLKVAQGKPAGVSDLFSGSPWFLRFIGATILFSLASGVGLILCIAPGIIVALMFSQYGNLIIDRDEGVLDSLSKSRDLTKGNRSILLAIFVVSMLPIFLISIPLPLLGASPLAIEIFSMAGGAIFNPWIYLLSSVCYLLMTGQPTADQVASTNGPSADPDSARIV